MRAHGRKAAETMRKWAFLAIGMVAFTFGAAFQRVKQPDWKSVPIVYQTYGYVDAAGVEHHRYCFGEDSQWPNPQYSTGDLQPGEKRQIAFTAQSDETGGVASPYLPTDGIHVCDANLVGLDAGNARIFIHVGGRQLDGIQAYILGEGPSFPENNMPRRTPLVMYGSSLTGVILPHTMWQDPPCPAYPDSGNVFTYTGAGHAGVYNVELKNVGQRVRRGVTVTFEVVADFCNIADKTPPEYRGDTAFIEAAKLLLP